MQCKLVMKTVRSISDIGYAAIQYTTKLNWETNLCREKHKLAFHFFFSNNTVELCVILLREKSTESLTDLLPNTLDSKNEAFHYKLDWSSVY